MNMINHIIMNMIMIMNVITCMIMCMIMIMKGTLYLRIMVNCCVFPLPPRTMVRQLLLL